MLRPDSRVQKADEQVEELIDTVDYSETFTSLSFLIHLEDEDLRHPRRPRRVYVCVCVHDYLQEPVQLW